MDIKTKLPSSGCMAIALHFGWQRITFAPWALVILCHPKLLILPHNTPDANSFIITVIGHRMVFVKTQLQMYFPSNSLWLATWCLHDWKDENLRY